MPAGRPSEFKEEYIDYINEYLKHCRSDIKELPSKEGFIIWLKLNKGVKVSKASIYNWEKENEEFLDALEEIEVEQKDKLQKGGLNSIYNSTITKLMLSSNHGMREGTDITSKGEKVIPILGGQSNVHNNNSDEETS